MDEERAILPGAVVATVIIGRIALVHVDVVDAIDLAGISVRAAECVDHAIFIRDGLIEERCNGVLQGVRCCASP